MLCSGHVQARIRSDDGRDQIPNDPKPVTLQEADGNYVILALGKGRCAFYAI